LGSSVIARSCLVPMTIASQSFRPAWRAAASADRNRSDGYHLIRFQGSCTFNRTVVRGHRAIDSTPFSHAPRKRHAWA
jgi:hypothetical protein